MNPEARKYLAAIGRRGGKTSRRTLTKAQARAMVRARTAKHAARHSNDQAHLSAPGGRVERNQKEQ
jgi:hypothetical protein